MDVGASKVRVAVVGVGHLGQHHARIYAEMPEVDLVAVSDISETRRREVGGRFKVRTAADYRELVGRVDAVSVAVPTGSHHAVALALLEEIGRASCRERV
jgi:predicted dehydrogenase